MKSNPIELSAGLDGTLKLPSSTNRIIRSILNNPLLFLLIVIVIFTIVFRPVFLSWTNFKNTIADASLLGIMGVAMTFIIIGRGIDLSIGSTMAITCVGVAIFHSKLGVPIIYAVVINLVIGIVIGVVIGLLVTKISIPPFHCVPRCYV